MSYRDRRGGTRVYVGNLSRSTRERDVEYEFDRYGRVARVDLKNGFGFVEFEDERDAEDAVRDMNGRDLDGRRLTVEFARGGRGRREERGGGGGGRRRGGGSGHRIRVEGLDYSTSWQDLKDFARKAGNVMYTDVWVDRGKKFGTIEYPNREDLEEALKILDDTKLDGKYVRLYEEGSKRSSSRSRSRSGSGSRRKKKSRRDRSGSRSGSRSRSPKKKKKKSRSRSRSRSGSRSRSRDRSNERKDGESKEAPAPATDDAPTNDDTQESAPANGDAAEATNDAAAESGAPMETEDAQN